LLLSDKHPKFSEKRGARQAFWFIFFSFEIVFGWFGFAGFGFAQPAKCGEKNQSKLCISLTC
jgi:hypothetical protein